MPVTWYCFFHRGISTGGLSDAERGKVVEGGGQRWQSPDGVCPYAFARASPLFRRRTSRPCWPLSWNSRTLRTARTVFGKAAACDGSASPDSCRASRARQYRNRECYATGMPSPIPLRHGARGLCSYLVHYPGPAENEQAWLDHYTTTHAPLMCALPGVRAVAVDTPAAVVSGLAVPVRQGAAAQQSRFRFRAGALGCAVFACLGKLCAPMSGSSPPMTAAASMCRWRRSSCPATIPFGLRADLDPPPAPGSSMTRACGTAPATN